MDWAMRASDIELCPHSPLALADVLSNTGNCFDLIAKRDAETNPCAEPANHNKAASATEHNQLQQRRQRRNPRQRANLLTQHESDTLFDRCKQIQVENALVKQPGIQRLYLVAGFVSIQRKNAENANAPLLFYPATLVRKPLKTSANGELAPDIKNTAKEAADRRAASEYEVRLDSAVPDTNMELLEWCKHNANCELPEFDSGLPLQDYFTQVAAAIADKDTLALEFDIALGTAASPVESHARGHASIQLPELPKHFNVSLAMAITNNKNLEQLNTVLSLLRDYRNDRRVMPNLKSAANESSQSISELRKYSTKLASAGLQDVEFQHLPTLPENISLWIKNVNKGLKSDMLSRQLDKPNISSRHLIRLAGVIELIDKAPMNLEQYKHADLCYSATPALLQRARHQARLIEDELAELQNTFVLDKVPAKKQLLSLIEELGVSLDHEPDIVDADYFNARRQFMEFSIEKPTNLTPEHRRLLGQLAKVLRFRELFVNNTEYRLALGPGYRGLRTDWNMLRLIVDYSQELSEILESESIAAAAMADWERFRNCFINELEILQTAAESLRKLLWVCGSQWQTRSACDVLEQAAIIKKKLNAWAEMHPILDQHTAKTPAKVMAQFTGKSNEDDITEIHVGETQATIDQHLNDGDASSDDVMETIEWLRSASRTASEHQLEITAIVEQL